MYEEYASTAFDELYTYTGSDLGATWSPEETFFRLWAPTARSVSVRFYATGDPEDQLCLRELTMEPDLGGTWVAWMQGNLSGLYYTYRVELGNRTVEACDPYARSTGVNGLRSMVVDLASANPEGWEDDLDPHFGAPITDAVIYELHIRDLSMERGLRFRHRGKYLGLTETGLITKGGQSVGIDHIRSLGVTHVHLLPVFDFGQSDESKSPAPYNWGYNPENFNVPEGSYSSNPHDGAARVRELKAAVKALHDNGLSVIMDVVYNHVNNLEAFCFNQIVPGYFSRISPEGVASNGSFCGNDTASERPMVRKYLVDSVLYWADEYHIDGFRFDLVGLIDTQTIREIMDAVHKTHPNVIFYGEGWTMGTRMTRPGYELTTQRNAGQVPGFAFFSDTIRDLLRGSTFHQSTPGYVSGGWAERSQLDACFTGAPDWAPQPGQCINYVSCHDNNTLFDRICLTAPEAPMEARIRMNNLAAAFCILSQGVPFMLAGEEMLRTKPGKGSGGFDENSYKSPDKVNCLKWDTLDQPEYAAVTDYYRGLIAFRKAHPALRLTTREDVQKAVQCIPCGNPRGAVYCITEGPRELYIIFNGGADSFSVPLPAGQPWDIHIQGAHAGVESIGQARDTITAQPWSATVLSRKRLVDVVAALVWEKDRFLICQRPPHKARGLLWEFVGGKKEPGETLPQALIRECREELGITVSVGREFMHVIHDYPDILIRLTVFHCTITSGKPKLLEHSSMDWIHPSQVGAFDFCPADADILEHIQALYGQAPPLT